jgi:2-oxoglutarate ferredoxin oxidoreductase subunit alpha
VPEKRIKQHIGQTGRILVVEMNQGQYVREIERIARDREVRFLGRMDGELISPKDIKERLDDWIA